LRLDRSASHDAKPGQNEPDEPAGVHSYVSRKGIWDVRNGRKDGVQHDIEAVTPAQ
jgi:hypothetical protein